MLDHPGSRPLLRVERIDFHEGTLLTAHGEIDHSSAGLLATELRSAEAARDVVVDLDEVTFLGAAGIRILLEYAEEVRDTGRSFAVGALRPQHRRLLERLGVLDELVVPCSRPMAEFPTDG